MKGRSVARMKPTTGSRPLGTQNIDNAELQQWARFFGFINKNTHMLQSLCDRRLVRSGLERIRGSGSANSVARKAPPCRCAGRTCCCSYRWFRSGRASCSKLPGGILVSSPEDEEDDLVLRGIVRVLHLHGEEARGGHRGHDGYAEMMSGPTGDVV